MVLYIDLDQSKQGVLVFSLKLPNQRVKQKTVSFTLRSMAAFMPA